MDINILGIDIAKNVFQLHGQDKEGKAVFKKRCSRDQLLSVIAQLETEVIVMEACSSSNYWCRRFEELGHKTKLVSPQYVKPFVKRNKNDANDAEAICIAASRPEMRFVSSKTIEQQDIQSIHRVRERLIKNRTALVNQVRGLLAEYGVIFRKGIGHLRKELPEIIEGENKLSTKLREILQDLYEELCELDKRIKKYDKKIENIYENNSVCQRLGQIEGLGVICATALIAAVGDAKVFKNGRQMSAWVGLTPRQYSSGDKRKLLGISKRGDCYLRKLLIHGARSVVYRSPTKDDKRSQWISNLAARRGSNKACVAVANKNMRIIWSMLVNETNYIKH